MKNDVIRVFEVYAPDDHGAFCIGIFETRVEAEAAKPAGGSIVTVDYTHDEWNRVEPQELPGVDDNIIGYFFDCICSNTLFIKVTSLVLALVLTACGTDESKDKTQAESPIKSEAPSSALKTKSDLPECNESRQNLIGYVLDEKSFYVCAGEWIVLDMNDHFKPPVIDKALELEEFWIDPVTDRKWLRRGWGDYICDATQNGFLNSYVKAEQEEAIEAIKNGILGDYDVNVFVSQGFYVNSARPGIILPAGTYQNAYTICVQRVGSI